jgi:hemolysin activation/secretion protein
MRVSYIALLAYIAGGFSAVALAQSVPTIADPAIQKREFEPRTAPRAVRGALIDMPETADQGAVDTTKVFTLNAVNIEGSTVYSADALKLLYADSLGKKVSFADLTRIEQAITAKYRADGYVLSRATLVPQTIEGGSVTFRVSEGYISEVTIEGDLPDSRGLVKRYADKISAMRPLNASTLERYLLLIDDLPGATARSVIKASPTDANGANLTLFVTHDAFEGALTADNRGSRTFGRYRGMATAAFNSALGLYDRTTVRGLMTAETDEMKYGELIHEEQLGADGLRLNSRIYVVDTNAGGRNRDLDIEGNTKGIDIGVYYPVIRSREQNFALTSQFSAQDSDVDLLGSGLSRDQVRSVSAGVEYDVADAWQGVNQVRVLAEHGLDALGATSDGAGRSRSNGEHDFTLASFDASRLQNISGPWSVLGSVSGQYSADALLASKEFALGGGAYGRAYDGGEIAGDQGVGFNLELRYSDVAQSDWLENYQHFVFFDGGQVWNRDRVFGDVGTDSITSAGVGTRLNMAMDWSASAELSTPLSKRVSAEGSAGADPRVFVSLTKRF